MKKRTLLLFAAAAAACAIVPSAFARTDGAGGSPCHVQRPATPYSGEPPAFAVPAGGTEVDRPAANGAVFCQISRADGTPFAEALQDAQGNVLDARYYRATGKLLETLDASYPASGSGQHAAVVQCNTDAEATIGNSFWTTTINWWITSTPSYLDQASVISAVRAAHTEWVSNVNYCGYADNSGFGTAYQGTIGKSFGQNGYSTFGWGDVSAIGCGSALACTHTWYDPNTGKPDETDTRMSTAVFWDMAGQSYDVQSIAAHEVGHSAQFDHVTNAANNDWTNLMWPYWAPADTTGRKLGRGDSLEDNKYY
jgi:hypothetical protein